MVLPAVPALRLPELSCHGENNDSHQFHLATSPCCHLHPSARDPSHGTSSPAELLGSALLEAECWQGE